MWRIEGFCSTDPPPSPEVAPTTYNPSRHTRSAFSPPYVLGGPRQFTRLMAFSTPGCDHQFYMRFRLFFVPDKHPVLAFCTTSRKIFFWDFERLHGYHKYKKALEKAEKTQTAIPQRPAWLIPLHKRGPRRDPVRTLKEQAPDRDSAIETDQSIEPSQQGDGVEKPIGMGQYGDETVKTWEDRYSTTNPHEPLKAHRVETVGATTSFVGRQVAWSPGGDWCVVVGSNNACWILERWRNNRKT
jgi:polycomb protein EED